MSWFDATGFANLAKSALKEAQKTIDKALDIKEENQGQVQVHKEDASDFFASWGLKNDSNTPISDKNKNFKQENTTSIWGSFTGSFFESPKFQEGHLPRRISHSRSLQSTSSETIGKSSLASSASFPDNFAEDTQDPATLTEYSADRKNWGEPSLTTDGSGAPNDGVVTVSSDLSETITLEASLDITDIPIPKNDIENIQETSGSHDEINDAAATCADKESDDATIGAEIERREYLEEEPNDTSIVSSESDKKSLKSVEALGSRSNTDCTTTPVSDGNTLNNSSSPSTMGPKLNSESVEILPDSLVTSPSSVEVLGDWKSDSSPYSSPIDSRQVAIDKDDSMSGCWEDASVSGTSGIPEKGNGQEDPSSSDISPYLSPMNEAIKTLSDNSCTADVDSTTSDLTYPSSHSTRNSPISCDAKISSDSVEVIPDMDETHETSIAEDSYTSASESTIMTILETFQQLEQTKSKIEAPESGASVKMHDPCPEDVEISGKISTDQTQLNLSLDSLKEKHSLHLPLEAITTQPIRKSKYLDSAPNNIKPSPDLRLGNFEGTISAIEPSEPEGHCELEDTSVMHPLKSEPTDATDPYFMSTDSSCEGTLIESGSEENPPLPRKPEKKISETPLTASSYVKSMLADAMVEKSEAVDVEVQDGDHLPRENSPISSESRSDLVKIGSDQTSGHTSGDELETTTSSDIEIISSPNGDSSSTQSRQSPAKLQSKVGENLLLAKTLKARGHSRELSEISIGSDETNLEIEKLLKRIQEMTEILEARESKLIDVSRMNMELHEQNNNLKKQLDHFEKHAEQNQSLNQITDEYTQRLSALERKFQQAIRERDSLRKNLEQLKVDAAARLSSQEMTTLSAEKDEIIKELREEGEKLSKQQLQHSNIIKKLRVKEKENDVVIKNQKEQIEEQTLELERLKRSLHAKEDVERTQIEAVHTLTAKSKKQEKEILSLQEKLDNASHKVDVYKKSLDAAKVDLSETKEILAATEVELKEATNNAGESCQLFAQVEELKVKLRRTEEAHIRKEEFLKHENGELLKRLETAEARSEELSESVSMATKPLLRQLEQLQGNLLQRTNSFMKQEKAMTERNAELQAKIENFIEMDRYLKEENVGLKSKASQLESKLTAKEAEKRQLQESCDEITMERDKLVEQNLRHQETIQMLEKSYSCQIMELKREISALENKLAVEKAAIDAERRKNDAMLEQQQQQQQQQFQQQQDNDDELDLSPCASVGRESVSSINSIWPALNDSIVDNCSGRYNLVYDSVRAGSSSTSIFENLQAQLKQRDGEVQQLQWELSRRNTERDALNTELSTLTLQIEQLSSKVSESQLLSENLNEIQTRYDALLQMYGEKMEENQELRLDLEDIKEMYKTQIDQLLKRDT